MLVELIGGPNDGQRFDMTCGPPVLIPLQPKPASFTAPDDDGFKWEINQMHVAVYCGPVMWHPDRGHHALRFGGYR